MTAVLVPVEPLMLVPLDLTAPNAEAKLQRILGAAQENPQWFGVESTAEDRLQSAYWLLTNPQHLTWEVWRGGELVGILLLWRIIPKVDALLHFVFFDRDLVGKVRLIRKFLRYCFEELGFQRISFEVPETPAPPFVRAQGFGKTTRKARNNTLVSFARRKLSFRFEGEDAVKQHPLVAELERATGGSGPQMWVAGVGSRRERAYWSEGRWIDVICLRLLAPEFRELHPGG